MLSRWVPRIVLPMIAFCLSTHVFLAGTMNTTNALEPPRFWTQIANDQKTEEWPRAVAVYLLFDRHVKAGISLRKLREILSAPTWLKEENVDQITKVGGFIPIKMMPGDTVFRVRVFDKENENQKDSSFAIYLAITGTIDKHSFFSILAVPKNEKTNRANQVREWGFSPTWKEFTRKLRP